MNTTKPVTVVGAANVDVTATPVVAYRPCESNPSRVTIGFGGVGRNIAHNLRLLELPVHFVSVFGDDAMAELLIADCRRQGMDIEPVVRIPGARSNYFICVNDECGEMQAGAADMELMSMLDVDYVASLMPQINAGRAVVADCNVSHEVLRFLAQESAVPLYVDATSAAKSVKIKLLFGLSHQAPLIVKVNRAEAQELTGIASDVSLMSRNLLEQGISRVYITLGGDGVYCSDGENEARLDAPKVTVVNATGAGDAFMAAVVCAELDGLPLAECARRGLEAAARTLQCAAAVAETGF